MWMCRWSEKMTNDKEKKYLAARWAAFITFLWLAVLATMIFLLDGVYPIDYITWMIVIGICGALMPWCFIDASNLP